MTGRERFEANIDAIDRAIARVCRMAGVRNADAEDFASTAKLAVAASVRDDSRNTVRRDAPSDSAARSR